MIGALEVVDEGADGVLPHERTTPKAKTDRLDLTRATHANLSPIWGLSLTDGLSALLDDPGEPVGRCVDEEGVVHLVERIVDPVRIAAISAAVAANPVLIADGHHRYAVSRSYRDEVRAATGRVDTDAELTMTYVAELVAEQLSIDPIHRVYRGISAEALEARLAQYGTIHDAGIVTTRVGRRDHRSWGDVRRAWRRNWDLVHAAGRCLRGRACPRRRLSRTCARRPDRR